MVQPTAAATQGVTAGVVKQPPCRRPPRHSHQRPMSRQPLKRLATKSGRPRSRRRRSRPRTVGRRIERRAAGSSSAGAPATMARDCRAVEPRQTATASCSTTCACSTPAFRPAGASPPSGGFVVRGAVPAGPIPVSSSTMQRRLAISKPLHHEARRRAPEGPAPPVRPRAGNKARLDRASPSSPPTSPKSAGAPPVGRALPRRRPARRGKPLAGEQHLQQFGEPGLLASRSSRLIAYSFGQCRRGQQ